MYVGCYTVFLVLVADLSLSIMMQYLCLQCICSLWLIAADVSHCGTPIRLYTMMAS